uniref:SET domain-containing protein n=1 Tax=Pygocentrus nattereri TaxID=42514 RepID=A0AAR2L5V7_PYGNA
SRWTLFHFPSQFVNVYLYHFFAGRGVFSLAQFSKRDFVVEYRGDRIDFYEAQRRRRLYHSLFTFFLILSLLLVNDDHKHPNCRMKMIEVDGRPHLCLFAIEDIKEGDEITYDYGGGDWPWRKKVYKVFFNEKI